MPVTATALHTPALTELSGFATAITTKVATAPILSATSLATPQPQFTLNVRKPAVWQLNHYLKSVFTDFNGFDPNIKLVPEDVSGDGQSDLVARDMYFGGSIALAIVYEDINGDYENDLIIYGYHGLFILLWTGETYSQPFRIRSQWGTSAAKYGSDMNVSFRDWTGDHVLDVIYDEGSSSGGTGFEVTVVERSIIHCVEKTCSLAWQDTLSANATDYNTGGLRRYQRTMQPMTDSSGRPALRIVDGGFSIYCCFETTSSDPVDSLDIYASTLSIYSWNGNEFTLSDRQVVSQKHIIDEQSSLQTTSPSGFTATIFWRDNLGAGNANEYCQLLISGKPVGPYWGCRHKFTTVEWKDITGDRQDEAVVITYSAGYPYGPDKLLSDEACMHQRILAYQWDGKNAPEIANVVGCVMGQDLYGVRLEDYDKDGQLEILAAPNGELHNRAYKWNGTKFILWSDVPPN